MLLLYLCIIYYIQFIIVFQWSGWTSTRQQSLGESCYAFSIILNKQNQIVLGKHHCPCVCAPLHSTGYGPCCHSFTQAISTVSISIITRAMLMYLNHQVWGLGSPTPCSWHPGINYWHPAVTGSPGVEQEITADPITTHTYNFLLGNFCKKKL